MAKRAPKDGKPKVIDSTAEIRIYFRPRRTRETAKFFGHTLGELLTRYVSAQRTLWPEAGSPGNKEPSLVPVRLHEFLVVESLLMRVAASIKREELFLRRRNRRKVDFKTLWAKGETPNDIFECGPRKMKRARKRDEDAELAAAMEVERLEAIGGIDDVRGEVGLRYGIDATSVGRFCRKYKKVTQEGLSYYIQVLKHAGKL